MSKQLYENRPTIFQNYMTCSSDQSKLVPKALSLELSKSGACPSQMRRPQRNLELPMSPIACPSTLEIMDTSALHTERCQRIGGGAGWSGGHVQDVPRVSTQKIPHRTVLDSFGPPPIVSDIVGHDFSWVKEQ